MNILCIGDIVGRPGREAVAEALPEIKKEHGIDLVIANAENASGGAGLIPKNAEELLAAGVDFMTMGDHVWDKPELVPYLQERQDKIIRPANFPDGAPGAGWAVIQAPNGIRVGIINLLGRTFMRYNVNCPFRALEAIAARIKEQTPVIVVDMHAETTSEKVAMGHFADGKVSVVFGTHTHIQTADEKILPQKTAYITDLGMSGPYDSVIGQDKSKIINRFLTSMPHKFEVAPSTGTLHGVVVTVNTQTGRAQAISRVQKMPAVQKA
ncbi:MAG: TIGR00282 family metallophosphoesterase [Candidatus Omnitrophica bacterium]|nr:TIGR00282 family metallophosphoesterase [Candidatus Omnitrophota bacterium]MDE2221652.1 TIGR00282 family metallophosphoesterase [Candidatus Omnitrophota bacterium]